MKRLIELCVRDYVWIHTAIGLLGNICFVIGSLLFLNQDKHVGTLFFIAGSSGMLIGSVGNAVVMAVEHRWRRRKEERERADRVAAEPRR